MPKMAAHETGTLHRAFSVFVFNRAGELLLQQRAKGKYHSPGLWTNTCCSHPRPGEATIVAAQRRLQEEMGMTCALEHSFSRLYRSEMSNGLTEHEYDHVFFGRSDNDPSIRKDEVQHWKYMSLDALRTDLEDNPQLYTSWLKILFNEVERALI